LRVFVHAPADAMADVLAHHRIASSFRVLLHRGAMSPRCRPWPALLNWRAPDTVSVTRTKASHFLAHLADRNCRGGVADNPSSVTPQSIEKMSPSFEFVLRRESMTTCSLTEAQIE
jgi:hypothetical protein